MISKLDRLQGRDIYENTALAKINELIDAANTIQKEREAERFEIQEWIDILEAVRKSVNIHEKQIDELQMKVNKLAPNINFAQPEVKDKFAEQRKWIGKLCKFWEDEDEGYVYEILIDIEDDGSDYPYKMTDEDSENWTMSYKHCEPVSEDLIYKGE